MIQELEQEYKTLINQDQYLQIKTYLQTHYQTQEFIQANAYYDRPDQALKDLKAAFRLRNFSDSSEWTLKQALTEIESIEINQANPQPLPVSQRIPDQAIQEPGLLKFFQDQEIQISDLRLTYQMVTKRLLVKLDQAEICLDQTQFGPIVDHELELEFSSAEGAKIWQQLLKRFKLSSRVPQKKIARAAAYQQA